MVRVTDRYGELHEQPGACQYLGYNGCQGRDCILGCFVWCEVIVKQTKHTCFGACNYLDIKRGKAQQEDHRDYCVYTPPLMRITVDPSYKEYKR